MTTRSTPCSMSRVAVECRRSWKRVRRSPARSRRPRKRRVRLTGSRGTPVWVVKTSPRSFQLVPETVRSCRRQQGRAMRHLHARPRTGRIPLTCENADDSSLASSSSSRRLREVSRRARHLRNGPRGRGHPVLTRSAAGPASPNLASTCEARRRARHRTLLWLPTASLLTVL